jgi:hypothetical protein
MSEFVGGMWTVAGFLGAACVIALLALVFVGLVRGIAKSLKNGGGKGGK